MSNDSPVADRVHDLLAPVIEPTGVELLDVEFTGGTLRLVIDHPADGGVTTEALAEVNRLVSPILDQHDPVPGRYTLEVSSPGVERPLRRAEHYRRAVGEDVIVKLVPEVEPRRLKGALVAVDGDTLQLDVVEVDGVDLAEPERRAVELDVISTGRTVFDWGPTPKKGGDKNRRQKNQKNQSKKKQPQLNTKEKERDRT